MDLARSMDNVRFMDLSGNRITSLVGLEGCPGLLELSVSENRITRTGECGAHDMCTVMVCTYYFRF